MPLIRITDVTFDSVIDALAINNSKINVLFEMLLTHMLVIKV